MVANFIPFEEPAGGPNFFGFNDDVRYSIKVDNTGDGREDITYEFRFHTKTMNPATFLYNTGPITYDPATKSFTNLNVVQTYDVQKITWRNGKRIVKTLGRDLLSPPNNVGPKSIANYDDLVRPAIYTLKDGSKVFAGQRDDPFFVDLGSTFDLINIGASPRPAQRRLRQPGRRRRRRDRVQRPQHRPADPQGRADQHGKNPTDANDPNSVVGVYSSADRPA